MSERSRALKARMCASAITLGGWLSLPDLSVAPSSDSVRTAASRGWGVLSAPFIPKQSLANHWRGLMESSTATGRKARGTGWREGRSIYVAATDAAARERAYDPNRGVHYYYNYLLNLVKRANMTQILSGDPAILPDSMTIEGVLNDLVVCGTPRGVADQLIAAREGRRK